MSEKRLPKIDRDDTVIVEVFGGVVSDYLAPKGIKVIIVDRDAMKCEEVDDLTLAAAKILDEET